MTLTMDCYPPVRFPNFETIPHCKKYTYPKFSDIKFSFPIENEKWDRVHSQIAKGVVEYPESNDAATIGEGRR
jgi:hypothetical protein